MAHDGKKPDEAACLRRAGWYVLIYAFSHAYFGVGSLRNAMGGAAGQGRVFAALFSASWLSLWLGGALLLAGKGTGRVIIKSAAFVSSLSFLTAFVALGFSLHGTNGIFILTQPLSGLALFFMITAMKTSTPSPGITRRWLIPVAAALLPWLIALALIASGKSPLLPSSGMGLFRPVFLSFWCALPFVGLLLAVDCMPGDPGTLLACGLAGTTATAVFTYGLIWLQSFNVFLMALLPPVVFTGQAVGIYLGMIWGKRDGETTGRIKPPGAPDI